jgi:pSer/pThr/pTyr-binding forkhead associated (FHA) protein/Mg-chelatase subunit ChlD
MKRRFAFLASFCTLVTLVAGWHFSQAQERGPVVDIMGKAETVPPNAHAYVSVIDPSTGRTIDGLTDANFAVQVSEQDVEATASLETQGVAVVMVIDRGGIAQQRDPRIGQAADLAGNLLDMLLVDGSAGADMVALIGIRGREDGGLTPLVGLTDYDPMAVRNEFDKLRTETVDEVTPLYDGIDQAIEWIAENDDAQVQEKLAHRRPIIVVFSDGIDNQFSSESHETIIINKCLQNDILLYAVRMEAPGRTTDADNLEALASQTNGIYITHNTDTHDQVLSLFDDIVTQRQSYRVTFPLYRPQGDYTVRIQALDTPAGDGSDETTVSSRLQLPKLSLTSPPGDVVYTVPYSHTPKIEIPLSVELTFPDGIERDPTAVRYYRNGVLIDTETTAPFATSWDATDYITQTEEARETQEVKSEDFTFTAEADDVYLSEAATSAPVNVRVEWEPLPPHTKEQELLEWLSTYWWLLVILAALAVGLLVLLILLIRTRGELARKVAMRTTGVLKGVTKRLSAIPQRAPGKLVVIQGANMGRELRLAAQVVKVGRDPQFCDFALQDSYTSNPHFSIQLEQTQFFITDEGSTNGTRVNGMPLQPHQRVLLQPDAIIEAGQTKLQFKRLGGETRRLEAQPPATPPRGQPAPPPGPVQQIHPPTHMATPPQSGQGPALSDAEGPPQPGPGQRGGPTKRV